jgi:hypothetical protein
MAQSKEHLWELHDEYAKGKRQGGEGGGDQDLVWVWMVDGGWAKQINKKETLRT